MNVIAWDIETCPQPLDQLTDAQRERYEKELAREMARGIRTEEDASRLVRSVHPMLGWICCISAASGDLTSHRNTRSWTAAEQSEEADLLARFWADIAPFKRTVWVTFNGKRFDSPWLLARTIAHGLTPSRQDILHTYPFKHRPHADLARVLPQSLSLNDLCDHLGVPSPKSDMTGADVAAAVAAGNIESVERYCARDVEATLACLQAAPCLLDA